MLSTSELMRKRDRLLRQVQDHLDFLAGSISSKGLRWEAYNLTTKIDGLTKSRHIPKDLVPLVRRMTRRYKKLKALLKELEQVNWLLTRAGVELRDHGTIERGSPRLRLSLPACLSPSGRDLRHLGQPAVGRGGLGSVPRRPSGIARRAGNRGTGIRTGTIPPRKRPLTRREPGLAPAPVQTQLPSQPPCDR